MPWPPAMGSFAPCVGPNDRDSGMGGRRCRWALVHERTPGPRSRETDLFGILRTDDAAVAWPDHRPIRPRGWSSLHPEESEGLTDADRVPVRSVALHPQGIHRSRERFVDPAAVRRPQVEWGEPDDGDVPVVEEVAPRREAAAPG